MTGDIFGNELRIIMMTTTMINKRKVRVNRYFTRGVLGSISQLYNWNNPTQRVLVVQRFQDIAESKSFLKIISLHAL